MINSALEPKPLRSFTSSPPLCWPVTLCISRVFFYFPRFCSSYKTSLRSDQHSRYFSGILFSDQTSANYGTKNGKWYLLTVPGGFSFSFEMKETEKEKEGAVAQLEIVSTFVKKLMSLVGTEAFSSGKVSILFSSKCLVCFFSSLQLCHINESASR